jgi:hypothetical protein
MEEGMDLYHLSQGIFVCVFVVMKALRHCASHY